MGKFIVRSETDIQGSDDRLSLSMAIAKAAENPGRDVIEFDGDLSTVFIDGAITIADAGPLVIRGDTNGDGLPDISISASSASRHFTVSAGATLQLDTIALIEGRDVAGTGGDAAGSIENSGKLVLNHTWFEDIFAQGGVGATGSAGTGGTDRGQASTGLGGSTGGPGGDGRTGGQGGDAATVLNRGELSVNYATFENTVAIPGAGGLGGPGGRGGNGGKGGDGKIGNPFKGEFTDTLPGGGGNGGTGGDGGRQGAHGEAAHGIYSSLAVDVTGAIVAEGTVSHGVNTKSAAAGSGGAGGAGGHGPTVFYADGSAGSAGSPGAPGAVNATVLLSEGSNRSLDQYDAFFSLAAEVDGGGQEAEEGDTISIAIARHSHDDGPYTVRWEVVIDGNSVQSKDFNSPTFGTATFVEGGSDLSVFELKINKDSSLEPQEGFEIRLTNPISSIPGKTVAATSETVSMTIASELGDNGDNLLFGTAKGDVITALLGDDTVKGAGGDDSILGQKGKDQLFGGKGADQIFGGKGADSLEGGADGDTLVGGSSADRVEGGAGADVLKGGAGKDKLFGDAGSDQLDAGTGADQLTGGAGKDSFRFREDEGNNVVTDFEIGADTIEILNGPSRFGNLTILETRGNAWIVFDGTSVELIGIDRDDLSASDFSFG